MSIFDYKMFDTPNEPEDFRKSPPIQAPPIDEVQAKILGKTEWWVYASAVEIVRFQLFTERLCMPLTIYALSLERALKRPVLTHELAEPEKLREEFLKKHPVIAIEKLGKNHVDSLCLICHYSYMRRWCCAYDHECAHCRTECDDYKKPEGSIDA